MPGLADVALVAAGSAAGGTLRYLIDLGLRAVAGSRFPWGVLAVNLAGCVLMGVLMATVRDERLRLTLATGLLGGFTTFSAFSWQSVELWQTGRPIAASAYVASSLVGCLAGCWLGWRLAR
jgi:CrcB protein